MINLRLLDTPAARPKETMIMALEEVLREYGRHYNADVTVRYVVATDSFSVTLTAKSSTIAEVIDSHSLLEALAEIQQQCGKTT